MNALKTAFLVTVIATVCCVLFSPGSALGAGDTGARVLGVEFQPLRPMTGDHLKVNINFSEEVVRADFKWLINGEEADAVDLDETDTVVKLERAIASGDKIEVTITPYDEEGAPGPMFTKKTSCGNAGPEMKLVRQNLTGETYEAEVEAVDPEGGKVALTLKQGPPGMKLRQDGRITWELDAGASGKFPVKVSAKDEAGAETILSFSFSINR